MIYHIMTHIDKENYKQLNENDEKSKKIFENSVQNKKMKFLFGLKFFDNFKTESFQRIPFL